MRILSNIYRSDCWQLWRGMEITTWLLYVSTVVKKGLPGVVQRPCGPGSWVNAEQASKNVMRKVDSPKCRGRSITGELESWMILEWKIARLRRGVLVCVEEDGWLEYEKHCPYRAHDNRKPARSVSRIGGVKDRFAVPLNSGITAGGKGPWVISRYWMESRTLQMAKASYSSNSH